MGEAFLPHVSVSHLKYLVAHERAAASRTRLLVALHRKQGKRLDDIAEAVSLHRRSVQDILHRFMRKGTEAAKSAFKPGRTRRLSSKQLNDLKKKLCHSPRASGFQDDFWTSKIIVELVKRDYGVSYKSRNVTNILVGIGFSYKKPRQTNPRRASAQKIRAFKKKLVKGFWSPRAREERGSSKTNPRFHSSLTLREGGI